MKHFLVDGHCDTITKIMETNEELYRNHGHVDLERLQLYKTPVQFFAAWLRPPLQMVALRQTMKIIDRFYSEMNKNKQWISPVTTVAEIDINRNQGKASAVLSIEGGEALEGEVSSLRMLYRLGVRAMTLTWNHRNQIGDGADEEHTQGSLTSFGVQVVQEMNELGMIVDVSHLSEAGFWKVHEISKKPYIASHSNARNLCNHPRNLADAQIKAIAQKGGVIGINSYPYHLVSDGNATIQDYIRHMEYTINLAGIDHIALGCDYDGYDGAPQGMEHVGKLIDVYGFLEKQYGSEGAEKVMGSNYLRVMNEVWR